VKNKQLNIIIRSIIFALILTVSIYLFTREENSGKEKCKVQNACGKCKKSKTCRNADFN